MLNLIVAEDEAWMREALRTQIDWGKLGIVYAGEAENGKHALELIQSVRPDIILADIQMPQMDGLTLMEELSRLQIDTNVIIISAYRNFQFAQKALKHGAFDYMLKPIYKEQVIDVVRRCVDKIKKKKEQATNLIKLTSTLSESLPLARWKFLESLTIHNSSSNNTEKLKALQLPLDHERTGAMCIQIYDWGRKGANERSRELIRYAIGNISEELIGNHWNTVMCPMNGDDADIILFLSPQAEQKEQEEHDVPLLREKGEKIILTSKSILGLSVSIGIAPAASLALFPQTFSLAANAASLAFYDGSGHIYVAEGGEPTYDKQSVETSAEWEQRLLLALQTDESQIVEQLIDELTVQLITLKHSHSPLDISRQTRLLFVSIIDRWMNMVQPEENILGSLIEIKSHLLTERLTIERIKPLFMEFISNNKSDPKSRQTNKRVMNKALSYIQEEYRKGITLNEVADYMFMSPGHFSKLFHEAIGITFSRYMVQLKINEAKHLLAETDLKIYEVAGAVGYNDFRHFAKTFKDMEGVTPAQYRKLNEGSLVKWARKK